MNPASDNNQHRRLTATAHRPPAGSTPSFKLRPADDRDPRPAGCSSGAALPQRDSAMIAAVGCQYARRQCQAAVPHRPANRGRAPPIQTSSRSYRRPYAFRKLAEKTGILRRLISAVAHASGPNPGISDAAGLDAGDYRGEGLKEKNYPAHSRIQSAPRMEECING